MANERFKKRATTFRSLGHHIVADPRICGGRPTFKGTRIMVWQVLSQIAEGMPWEQITWSWRGRVQHEAIAEALKLASGEFKSPHYVSDRRERLRARSLAAA